MSDMPENPAAFPRDNGSDHKGMSLRDWFAGQAIVSSGVNGSAYSLDNYKRVASRMASQAYLLADAMLAAREI